MDANPEKVFERIVQALGSQRALAAACGVKPQAVGKWRRRIPAERVLRIEAATNCQVTRHEMRPDIYPNEAAA